jgi:outer membrane receptor protein involved in Fe transport
MRKTNKTLLAASLCVAAYGATALAEEAGQGKAIEEIVVTATKRASTIQDVPFSINAQTQEDIQRSGAQNLEDLSRNVAGLAVQNLGPGQSQVSIRGVSAGQIIRDQPGVKEQVGIYLDESVISLSLFTPDLDLFDLNRVETLRGPQGTLFGSGSVGGTIRYITNQPNPEQFEGLVEANLNTTTDGGNGGHLKGMVNVPLSDGKSALRIVGYTTEYGGFMDALGENGRKKEDVDSGNRSGGRIALKWAVNDDLTITQRVVYQKIEADGFNRQEVFNLFANPYTTTRPAIQLKERQQYLLLDEKFEDETTIADVTVDWKLDMFDVTFVTSYTDREILVSRDASALTGSVTVSLGGLGFPESGVTLPSNLRDTTDLKQSTYELRFSSNDEGKLQWLVGVFYADAERTYAQRLPTPGYDAMTDAALGDGVSDAVANGFPANSPYNADLPYENTQFAVFGELTYDMTDRLHITAGGRYYDFEEERRFTSGGLFSNGDDQFDKTTSDGFNPRVMLSFDLNENSVLNAQASEGFRQGGDNDPLNEGLCSGDDVQTFGGYPNYDDETLWNYEAGIKSRFDNGVTVNAAVFYADISDLQVTQDAGSCSSRVVFNVSDAHTAGVELELTAPLSDNLDFSFAVSLLEAEFDSSIYKADGSILGGMEKGNRLPSVPEYQLAGTATYTFPFEVISGSETYIAASVQHIGDRYTQPGDQVAGAGDFASNLPYAGATGTEVTSLDLELDAYTIMNLSAGIVNDEWEAVLYVNNLTDENADLSFDRERGGRARLGFRTNMPRNFGITFRKMF